MSEVLSLTLSQYAPSESVAQNVERIERLATVAAGNGSEILVMPEYSAAFTPSNPSLMATTAEALDGRFIGELSRISRANGGLIIVAGMVIQGQSTHSAIVAVGPEGVLAVAEKIHLYDAFGGSESSWLSPGQTSAPQLLRVGKHTLGFMACYDLRFSEVASWLVHHGATTLVVPAQWVPGPRKKDHWNTLLRARAIEFQCFVVGVGQPAPHGVGHSQVVNPVGDVVLQMDSTEQQGTVGLDISDVLAAREANPMALARRFRVVPER